MCFSHLTLTCDGHDGGRAALQDLHHEQKCIGHAEHKHWKVYSYKHACQHMQSVQKEVSSAGSAGNTEKQGFQKMEIQFFLKKITGCLPVLAKHLALYRWLQKCQNSLTMHIFDRKKKEFPFFKSLLFGIASSAVYIHMETMSVLCAM